MTEKQQRKQWSGCTFLPVIGGMLLAGACVAPLHAQQPLTARTPATPLVVHDPYFSVWSFDDTLDGGPTRHWTGTEQQLNGLIRIDGHLFRFMGEAPGSGFTNDLANADHI